MKITSLAVMAFSLTTAAPAIAQPLSARRHLQRRRRCPPRSSTIACVAPPNRQVVVRLDIADGRVAAVEVREGRRAAGVHRARAEGSAFPALFPSHHGRYPFISRLATCIAVAARRLSCRGQR